MVTFFNVALGYHLGIEVFLVTKGFEYADRVHDTSEEVLAYVGSGVVIAHLIPFFIMSRPTILRILAFAGIIVNILLCLLTIPELGSALLLLLGASSANLLLVTNQMYNIEEFTLLNFLVNVFI